MISSTVLIKSISSENNTDLVYDGDVDSIVSAMLSMENGNTIEEGNKSYKMLFKIGFIYTVTPTILAEILRRKLTNVKPGIMYWQSDSYTATYTDHNGQRIITENHVDYTKFTARYLWIVRLMSAVDGCDKAKIIYDRFNNFALHNNTLTPLANTILLSNTSLYFGAENPLVQALSNQTRSTWALHVNKPNMRIVNTGTYNNCSSCGAILYDLFYYNKTCQYCQYCKSVIKCNRWYAFARSNVTIHDRINVVEEPYKSIYKSILEGTVPIGKYTRAGNYLFVPSNAKSSIFDAEFNFTNMTVIYTHIYVFDHEDE